MQKGFFEKEIELRFCDCDYKKRAKTSTLMANMADIAGIAYAKKGYSHTWLWERDFVFLVSRVSIHINRVPKADEALTVTTWEREVKGVLFYRDFSMTDSDGKVVVEASTAWVLANPTSRQILRPNQFTGVTDVNPEIKANVIPPNRIKLPDGLQKVADRRIVYSDIDANGHVYNAVYLAIACDSLPAEFIDRDIVDLQINFKQEAKLGEQLAISTQIIDSTAYIVGEIDTTVSFEASITVR